MTMLGNEFATLMLISGVGSELVTQLSDAARKLEWERRLSIFIRPLEEAPARPAAGDHPGWSLVARTDDIAFILLDEEPGEVLPVGRGPELPGLLEALDKMAVRPS